MKNTELTNHGNRIAFLILENSTFGKFPNHNRSYNSITMSNNGYFINDKLVTNSIYVKNPTNNFNRED